MNKTAGLIGAAAVIIVVAAGWYIWQERDQEAGGVRDESTVEQLAEEEAAEQAAGLEAVSQPLDEEFNVAIESTTLAAIPPYTGSGLATRVFDDNQFTHTVTANIDAPATGTFYEGWLVMPAAAGPQFFSTGRLEEKNNAYVLTFTADQDYPSHTQVVVTEETERLGLDGVPEDHVLEGSFDTAQ